MLACHREHQIGPLDVEIGHLVAPVPVGAEPHRGERFAGPAAHRLALDDVGARCRDHERALGEHDPRHHRASGVAGAEREQGRGLVLPGQEVAIRVGGVRHGVTVAGDERAGGSGPGERPRGAAEGSGRGADTSIFGQIHHVMYTDVPTRKLDDPMGDVAEIGCPHGGRLSPPRPVGAVRSRPASVDVDAGDGPADDQPLDLRGALEDGVDLRVAVPALDRVLADVAVAAHDLDRLLGHPDRGLAGVELGHRALARGELLAVPAHPRRSPDEQAGGVDAGLHVGELEGDGLVFDDRLAEGLALLGVVERVLVGGPGDAERLGADRRTRGLEGLHGRLAGRPLPLAGPSQALVELVLAAEQAVTGNPHVVEDHLGGVRGADPHLLELLALRQPWGPWRDDEAGLAPRPEGAGRPRPRPRGGRPCLRW